MLRHLALITKLVGWVFTTQRRKQQMKQILVEVISPGKITSSVKEEKDERLSTSQCYPWGSAA
jgi:hypothetical protein